jgi:amino acid transporter
MKWKIVLFLSIVSLFSFVITIYTYHTRLDVCGYAYNDYSHLTPILIGNGGGIIFMFLAIMFYYRSWEGSSMPEHVQNSIKR